MGIRRYTRKLDEPAGIVDPEHSNAISVRTRRRQEQLERLEGPEEDVLEPIGGSDFGESNEQAYEEQWEEQRREAGQAEGPPGERATGA